MGASFSTTNFGQDKKKKKHHFVNPSLGFHDARPRARRGVILAQFMTIITE